MPQPGDRLYRVSDGVLLIREYVKTVESADGTQSWIIKAPNSDRTAAIAAGLYFTSEAEARAAHEQEERS